MVKLSARLLFGASLCVAIVGSTTGVCLAQALTQTDLRDAQAVATALKSQIDSGTKRSAEQAFSLGLKYRNRAAKDGNWGPAAKAFGDSAVLHPRSLALKEYAESSLRSQSKVAAAKGLEEQLAVLRQAIDLYGSALAADDVLRELTPEQRAELVQRRTCAERFVQERKFSSPCQPLQWIGLRN
jgi:hypothetical protein